MASLSALCANDEYMRSRGETARDRAIAYAKRDFERQVVDNPGYVGQATRNGKPQRFLVTRSDVTYKSTITAYPDEDLVPGDIVEFEGQHWIIYQTRVTNAIQISGIAWLCNHKFRFQTFSSEIHERWGVLDNGVYSTTRTSDSTVMTLDMQYKIYLPADEVTEKIYEDQRFATDTWVDKNGIPILLTYGVTGRDRIARSYGENSHLLILNARSTSYNPETDNYEEMICDYISPDDEPIVDSTPPAAYRIDGRNYIRIGSSRAYYVSLFSENGEIELDPAKLAWEVFAPNGVTYTTNLSSVIIDVPEMKALLGQTITLRAFDPDGNHGECQYEIEVTL